MENATTPRTTTIVDDYRTAVEDYTGMEVAEIAIAEDPRFAGVYAIRAIDPDGYTVDFLHTSGPIDAENLEDVEFASWPPRAVRSAR